MKKVYIGIGVAVALIVSGLLFFKFKSNSLEKTLEKVQAYDKYTMTCNMEMVENDELKSYLVNVAYFQKDKQEYFKVELYDKSLNQSQVIVKNKDGVFVLTPTLNQIFKFQSDWPNNSPKPYIYQSLLKILDKGEVEKTKDGYLVKGDITYPNDSRVKSQEVLFDKSLAPVRVVIYDKDEAEIIKVEVSEFSNSPKINADSFNQEKVLKDSTSQYSNVSSSLPLYPVALMGSKLSSEDVSKIEGTTNHILKFTGDKDFTVVESVMTTNDAIVEEAIDGEVVDLVDGVAFYNENQLTMMQSGIMCKVYSNDLSKEEMVNVINSMQSSSLK